jgi:hypothetical protein
LTVCSCGEIVELAPEPNITAERAKQTAIEHFQQHAGSSA